MSGIFPSKGFRKKTFNGQNVPVIPHMSGLFPVKFLQCMLWVVLKKYFFSFLNPPLFSLLFQTPLLISLIIWTPPPIFHNLRNLFIPPRFVINGLYPPSIFTIDIYPPRFFTIDINPPRF